jgi:5-methyltetrahydrofolate--homocysteine methyltransferase
MDAENASKGKVLLATVKGDVHDIGKNLVEIILSNNGFNVINLGIKVPPQDLIDAYQTHKPDMIGLSGLLVKSAQMMVQTVRDFQQSGVNCPILVGGAALSNRFTRMRIAPEHANLVVYASDAMTGLSLANTIREADEREKLAEVLAQETEKLIQAESSAASKDSATTAPARPVVVSRVSHEIQAPSPPDLLPHVLRDFSLDEIFPYINPQMLYVRHLGFRGRFNEALAANDPGALELRESVRRVEDLVLESPNITADAVFKFFPSHSAGQDLLICRPDGGGVVERFHFGRQSQGEGLCLADFVRPISQDSLPKDGPAAAVNGSGTAGNSSTGLDYVGMFVTTVGPGVSELSERLKSDGRYLDSHILQSLAIESAEAFAEVLHQRMRRMWGFSDSPDISYQDLFRTQYRGRRFSFGYPACPRLEDQEQLFRLLDVASNIGVELTEGFMMEPESTVSALVLHHPDAKYFNLSPTDIEFLEQEAAQV